MIADCIDDSREPMARGVRTTRVDVPSTAKHLADCRSLKADRFRCDTLGPCATWVSRMGARRATIMGPPWEVPIWSRMGESCATALSRMGFKNQVAQCGMTRVKG